MKRIPIIDQVQRDMAVALADQVASLASKKAELLKLVCISEQLPVPDAVAYIIELYLHAARAPIGLVLDLMQQGDGKVPWQECLDLVRLWLQTSIETSLAIAGDKQAISWLTERGLPVPERASSARRREENIHGEQ